MYEPTDQEWTTFLKNEYGHAAFDPSKLEELELACIEGKKKIDAALVEYGDGGEITQILFKAYRRINMMIGFINDAKGHLPSGLKTAFVVNSINCDEELDQMGADLFEELEELGVSGHAPENAAWCAACCLQDFWNGCLGSVIKEN